VLGIIVLLEVQEGVCPIFVVVIQRDQSPTEDIDILHSSQIPINPHQPADTLGVDSAPNIDLYPSNPMGLMRLDRFHGEDVLSATSAAPMAASPGFELDFRFI
jgi:hypothetical protein